MLTYITFINRVIDDGIKAATEYYTERNKMAQLEGSIAGFEECRAYPHELVSLYYESMKDSQTARFAEISSEDYWRLRCRHLEIEWCLNVTCAAMIGNNQPPLIEGVATASGMMKAAEILKLLYTSSLFTGK